VSKEIALGNEILRGVVGSTAHGTAVDGQDDRDEMAIFVEPALNVCGLSSCDHYQYRDAAEGERSKPGDLDLISYSLRRYCELAERGNPSVLLLMWLPQHMTKSPLGAELIQLRDAFISRTSGARFLGYLTAQKLKMTGERAHTVHRPDLVELYGFDTKFAMHALRLGFQGCELLTTRNITLPVAEPNLSILRGVRTGKYTEAETLAMIEEAEERLHDLIIKCTWKTERAKIDDFLVTAHLKHWNCIRIIKSKEERYA
jgi:hypothetical protein